MDIPQEIFDTYYRTCDDFIDKNFGVTCTLSYPESRTDCPNCVFDPLTKRSANIYVSGGPIEFTTGNCPYCNGLGYMSSVETEDIKLRCYYEKRSWVKMPITINQQDGSVQTIGHIADLPKVLRCSFIVLNSGVEAYRILKYELAGEPQLWGFKKNKYFICMWDRI